jgi:hypothetical protein
MNARYSLVSSHVGPNWKRRNSLVTARPLFPAGSFVIAPRSSVNRCRTRRPQRCARQVTLAGHWVFSWQVGTTVTIIRIAVATKTLLAKWKASWYGEHRISWLKAYTLSPAFSKKGIPSDRGWWLRVRQVPYNYTSNAADSVRKLSASRRAEAVSKLLCMIPCAN